jgi:small subunit ribosomal protein S2
MKRQPDALLVVDLRKEAIAVREARRLGLPVVALVDTNCDPDEADFVVPGNDDAIKSCDLVVRTIADAMEAGKQKVKPEEFAEQAAPAPAPAAEAAPPAEEEAPAPDAEAAPPSEDVPADEQLSQGESAEEAAQPPVRDSGPVEGASGEPGGSPGESDAVPESEGARAE